MALVNFGHLASTISSVKSKINEMGSTVIYDIENASFSALSVMSDISVFQEAMNYDSETTFMWGFDKIGSKTQRVV